MIYLASASPRRQELLQQLGIAFEAVPSNIAEQRALLFQLNQVHGMLSQRSPGAPETALLLQAHSNLYRMWAEL